MALKDREGWYETVATAPGRRMRNYRAGGKKFPARRGADGSGARTCNGAPQRPVVLHRTAAAGGRCASLRYWIGQYTLKRASSAAVSVISVRYSSNERSWIA